MKKVYEEYENEDESKVIAIAITRLFNLWGISQESQCSLLGINLSSRNTLNLMGEGVIGIPAGRDSRDRVGNLLSIHKALRLLYPKNPELLSGWITRRNKKFDGRTPLEVMIEDGYLGVVKVSHYLNMCLGR